MGALRSDEEVEGKVGGNSPAVQVVLLSTFRAHNITERKMTQSILTPALEDVIHFEEVQCLWGYRDPKSLRTWLRRHLPTLWRSPAT